MSIDVSVAWLQAWSPTGPWFLGELDPAIPAQRLPAHRIPDESSLRAFLEQRFGRSNLYFCPNVITTEEPVTTTPTKEQITHITSLYVDLDLPKAGPYAAPNEENFARLLKRLRALDPPPTTITFSGGGYQAFWLFPAPLPAPNNLERIEAASKAIGRTLKSDAVQNINRWMRLPGTMNLPNELKRSRGRVPALSRVIEAFWDRRWSIDHDPIPSFPDDYAAYEDPDTTNDQQTHKTTHIRSFIDLPIKWQKLVRSGDATDYNTDRSRLVIAFCFAMARRGWSDEQIIPFITDPTYPISSHVLEQSNPSSYARRQITQARTFIAKDWDYTAQGRIDPNSPKNVRRALDEMGIRLSHNTFSDRSYINGAGPFRPLDDTAESEMRINTHDRFNFMPPKDLLRDLTVTIAHTNSFHPVTDYLSTLRWDKIPRLETWLINAAQAEDSPYTRAISRLILIAAVRRVRHPGCKFDQMLVLVDPQQGTGKSTAISSLVPDPQWFSDSLPLRLTDQKAIEQLSGKWIIECAELQGMHQADVDALKAFLSRTEDRARLAYGHHPVSYARRCVFFATTNTEAFLRDVQNRRFWPVRVSWIDVPQITEIRDQLWAEAAYEEALGASIILPEALWAAAAVHQEAARFGDPWADELLRHFASIQEGRISSAEVWKLLGKPPHQRGASDNGRLTEVMRELGWSRSIQKISGATRRCFMKGDAIGIEWFTFLDPVDGTLSLREVGITQTQLAARQHAEYDELPL